ncbi:MAG: hypothetical protein AAGK04_13335, partial [Planctomycetota bacterium]
QSSISSGSGAINRFVPWGNGDDPWLAATMPEDLGLSYPSGTLPLPEEMDDWILDWPQISNFAPDGRFVNLYNLRNNFKARPGSDTGEMSYRVTLLEVRNPEQRVVPTVRLPYTGEPIIGVHDDRPAAFTMHQIGAFRPIEDPNYGPNSQFAIEYQWADADGDGMADSRWFELTDAAGNQPGQYSQTLNLLPPQDDVRWFVAARAIDLSGLVNLNTATDFKNLPAMLIDGLESPPGATPADVDRLRLLAGDDTSGIYTNNDGEPLTYNDITQPLSPGDDRNDYSLYAGDMPPFLNPARIADRAVANLAENVLEWDRGAPATDAEVSSGAYDADTGRVDTPNLRSEWFNDRGSVTGGVAFDDTTGQYTIGGRLTTIDQIELLTYWGLNDPDVTTPLEKALSSPVLAANYDPASLSPYRLTQPYSLLRSDRELDIERRVDANADGVADDDYQALVATDIRRLITLESGARRLYSWDEPGASTSELLKEAISLPEILSGNPSALEREELFQTIYSTLVPNQFETTAWAGDPEFDAFRFRNYGYESAELGLRLSAHITANLIDSYDANDEQTVLTVAISETGYDILDTEFANYPVDTGMVQPYYDQWLAQGGAGSGLTPAQLGWARWNSGASRINEDVGDVLTPSPNRAQVPDLSNPGVNYQYQSDYINVFGIEPQPFITEVASFFVYTDAPWAVNGNEAGLGGEGLDTNAADEKWDLDLSLVPTNPGDVFEDDYEVSIDGDVDIDNDDYIVSIVVFQLHNPFDELITLSSAQGGFSDGDAIVLEDFYYYIEFGGRHYKLVEYDWNEPDPNLQLKHITLLPGETRNFYVIGEDPTETGLNAPETRLQAVEGESFVGAMINLGDKRGLPGTQATYIEEWIRQQASIRATPDGALSCHPARP